MPSFTNGRRRVYNKVQRTTRTALDTLTVDPDLHMSVDAGEWWRFRMMLRVTTTSAADFKFTLGVPSGATGWVIAERIAVGGRTLIDFQTSGYAFTDASAADEAVYEVSGVIKIGSVGGSLALKWAQNTSDASDTIVGAGSFMDCEQLSS